MYKEIIDNDFEKMISDSYDINDENIENIELMFNNIYKISKEAIENKNIDTIYDTLNELSRSFEKIENLLEIENPINKRIYYFGMISAITNFTAEINEDENKNKEAIKLFDNYKFLYSFLSQIDNLYNPTGNQLKEVLNLKSTYTVTNYYKKIEDYELVYVQRFGNIKYYTLTPKGKKYLFLYNSNKLKEQVTSAYIEQLIEKYENTIVSVLDKLVKQVKEEEPNSLEVLSAFYENNIFIKNINIIKLKIHSIFSSREEYMRNLLYSKINKSKNELAGIESKMTDNENISKSIYNIDYSFSHKENDYALLNLAIIEG
ncbi:hypothetical protein [Ruminococcus sp.]|uniref:hypothetical protein n=1 Tax=Ruminococcus sp. TaxID=41978 RepID=UPI003522BB28